MNVVEIEQAARLAWPALEEEELPFGVLRYASGTDRRANSLSLYPDAELVPGELIGAAEKFFGDRKAASIVRMVRSAAYSRSALEHVDRALASRGYEKQSPTLTMLLDLANISDMEQPVTDAQQCSVDLSAWLHAWYALTGRAVDGIDVHRSILERLEPAKLLLLNRSVSGVARSTGMGVLSGSAVGLFGIATAVEHRQQGYASAVLRSLLQWALLGGAKFAYLQVEESNTAAIKLYRKMGFTEVYSYWYRVGN